MKFTILDVYPSKNHRLVKDTAGGYGTGNNFGDTAFSKLLNLYVDKSIGMPSIESMYVSSILKKEHDVAYTRDINDKAISDSDYIILPSSIVSHETEIEAIRSHGRVWKYKGTAKVNGKRMADAEWSATIVDRKE